MVKRDTKIYLILAIIIILIITGINFYPKTFLSEKELLCIGKNSKLYTLSSCGHCQTQKKLIQENLDKYNLNIEDEFNVLICNLNVETTKTCQENNIQSVPLWIINNQQHLGVQSLEKLKELTGC